MPGMKQHNLPSLLTTLKVPGNIRHKETSYLGTELGRWPSTLLLYGQIPTDGWCIMDMVEGHHPLVVYWVKWIKGCHASHQNQLELYCTSSRNNKRDKSFFCNSSVPDVPNCLFGPTTSEHSSAATTLILSRRLSQNGESMIETSTTLNMLLTNNLHSQTGNSV